MSTATYRVPRRDLALLWHQVRYEQPSFWRNPQSALFTFAFPVVIMPPGRTSWGCWRTASW